MYEKQAIKALNTLENRIPVRNCQPGLRSKAPGVTFWKLALNFQVGNDCPVRVKQETRVEWTGEMQRNECGLE